MSVEHDVTMLLGTKLRPGGDEALRQMRSSTKELAAEEQKYQDLLKKRIASYETALRLQKDIKLHAEKMGHGPAGQAPNAAGAVQGVAGAIGFNLPTSAFAALTATIAGVDAALRTFRQSLNFSGQFVQGRAEDILHRDYISKIPIAGEISQFGSRTSQRRAMFGMATGPVPLAGQMFHDVARKHGLFGSDPDDDVSFIERSKNLRRSEQQQSYDTERFHLESQLGARQREMGLSYAGALARPGILADQQLRNFGSTKFFGAQAEAAMAQAGGTVGYGRAAEQADIARREGMAVSLSHVAAERDAQLRGFGVNRSVLQAQGADLGRQHAGLTKELGGLTKELGGLQEGTDAYYTKRGDIRTKRDQITEVNNQLEANKEKLLQTEHSTIESITQSMLKQQSILQNQHSVLTQIVRSEAQRKQSLREDFGLMHPREQMGVKKVAAKIGAKQNLTAGEFQFARQHMDIFGDAIRGMGAARGDAMGFDQVYKDLNLGARGKQAEAERIDISNKIEIELHDSGEAIAGQVVRAVQGAMDAISAQIKAEIQNKLSGLKNEQSRANNAPLLQ